MGLALDRSHQTLLLFSGHGFSSRPTTSLAGNVNDNHVVNILLNLSLLNNLLIFIVVAVDWNNSLDIGCVLLCHDVAIHAQLGPA